jgi:hypothetical protein
LWLAVVPTPEGMFCAGMTVLVLRGDEIVGLGGGLTAGALAEAVTPEPG